MSNSNATCYVNDGVIATSNYFCGLPNQGTCCGDGWECLSNGICGVPGTDTYAQGTCIDPRYKDCLSFCNYAQPGNFTVVKRCDPAGNSWCFQCNLTDPGGPSCCDTNHTTTLEPYPFSVGTPPQSTVDDDPPSTTSIPFVPDLTLIPSSSSSPPGTSLEPTSEISIKTSTQTATTPSGAWASSPSTQSTNQSHGSKTDIYVGTTVAVVVVALAIVAFFIFQKSKVQTASPSSTARRSSVRTGGRNKDGGAQR